MTRACWSLAAGRVARDLQGLDIEELLARLDKEMPKAPEPTRWTRNSCLTGIGIHLPEHRERAMAIGEKDGLYRHWPISKGRTSPFVPAWIAEMVKRQG